MSVNKAIRTALAEYINAGWPVHPDTVRTDADHYITFNTYYDKGDDYGDDAPESNVLSVYVHMYLPDKENYLQHKSKVRKLLFEGGFSYANVTELTDPDREGLRHIIFDVEYVEESEV
jgi:hypothetical protein